MTSTSSTSVVDGKIAAAIDIGSNSIKMTVGRPDGAGGVDELEWASEVVRLGQDLDQTGQLDEARAAHAIETVGRFAARARALGADPVLAVATEAARTARNGSAFLDHLREETGVDVRVLDGQEEAALTFKGLATSIDTAGPLVVADIGGGSTELIVAQDGAIQNARSMPLGSGRLTDRLIATDPPTPDELAACEIEAAKVLERATSGIELPASDDVRLVIVGGTGEFMARLVPDESNITIATVRDVLDKLSHLTAAQLSEQIGIPLARARVLPAGVAIVAAVADRVRSERIDIARSGIRVGLLAEAFETWAPTPRNDGQVVAGTSAAGSAIETPEPTLTETVPQEPSLPGDFRETMRALIAERWDAVWRAIPAALAGTDIEGVHDVRVASRRLRAAMDVAAPVFPRKWFRPLHKTARSITAALGAVRDRDVLLEALHADRDAAPLPERPGIDRLIERVDQEREVARAAMEQFLVALLEGPLREEVARRFGPASLPIEPRDRSNRGKP